MNACHPKRPRLQKSDGNQKQLKDSEGFDWLVSTELNIDKQKFLLNRLYEKQPIPQVQDCTCYECFRFFPSTFVLLRFNIVALLGDRSSYSYLFQ